MRQARTSSVAFIFVTLLLDTLGLGLIIPVLPNLVASIVSEGNLPRASGLYGDLVSVYALMQFAFAPVVGGLSDRFGRRPVILVSLLGAAVSYLLSATTTSLVWFFVGRVVAGITGASFSAAASYIADVTPKERRAQGFGIIGAAFGLGFILGPALGGLLGQYSLRLPFYVAVGLNLANFLYGLYVLPESLPAQNRRRFDFARSNPLSSLWRLGRHPVVLGLTGTIVCSYLAQAILNSVWVLDVQQRFNFSRGEVGLSMMVIGFAAAIVQGGVVRAAIPRLGEQRALLVGLSFTILGFVGFGLATRGYQMYLITIPFALGGIAGPATQALISREVGPSAQGELQGSLASLMSLSMIVGPQISTGLFARFSPLSASPHIPGAAYFAAALISALGFGLALRLFRTLGTAPGAKPEAAESGDSEGVTVATAGAASLTRATPRVANLAN